MASLTYNGITLSMIHTEGVEQTAERDESGADTLFTLIRIRIGCVFSPYTLPGLGIPAAATMQQVRHMLLQPRKDLLWVPNGAPALTVVAPDDGNGPEPESCHVRKITPENWDVTFTIAVRIRDCDEGATPRPWLSLRWEDSITYSEDWFNTYKRSGTLILSSRDASGPEAYRGLVTPGVPAGFRRKSADYALTRDGLRVRFSFTDVELAAPPPKPILKLTGRMVVSTPLPGAIQKGEIALRLIGPKTTPKTELMASAIRLAMARVNATNVVKTKTNKILIGGAIEEDLDDERNAVGLSMHWQIKLPAKKVQIGSPVKKPDDPDVTALGGGFDWLGQPLQGADPKRGIGPPTFGTAENVRLVAAALNDPCGSVAPIRLAPKQRSVVTLKAGNLLDPPVKNEPTPVPTSPPPAVANVEGNPGTVEQGTLTVAELADDNAFDEEGIYPDTEGTLYGDDGPGVYEVYRITSHYSDDPGVEIAPSTRPGDTARKLQFHAGLKRLRVEFSATKTGGVPTIPNPQPDDPNVVYLGGVISPEGPDLAADAETVRYTVSGVLEYGFLDPSLVVVSAPIPPFLSRTLLGDMGLAASKVGGDIAFPTAAGADPFDGKNVEEWGGGGGDF